MVSGRHVLAGFDGSPAAERALRWAADEASLRGVPLRICHAWHWPYPRSRRGDGDALEIVRRMGAMVLEDGVRLAQEAAPGLAVEPLLVKGTAPGALLAASAEAALIVVGARGAGGFDRLPVGSTAAHVPAHADRPVVVVPAHERPAAGRIVVGVDGSPASRAALRFALRAARLREAVVTLVCAWWDPAALPGPDRLPFTDPQTIREQAQARFAGTVAESLAGFPDVAVEQRFVMERPHRALLTEARDAMLLVVGDRGIGASPQTLLGAVARAVLHQAPSPIAIVHERDPDAKEPPGGGGTESGT